MDDDDKRTPPPADVEPMDQRRIDLLEEQLADDIPVVADAYREAGWETEEFDAALQSVVERGRRGDLWGGVDHVATIDMRIPPPAHKEFSEEREKELYEIVKAGLPHLLDAFEDAGWGHEEVERAIIDAIEGVVP